MEQSSANASEINPARVCGAHCEPGRITANKFYSGKAVTCPHTPTLPGKAVPVSPGPERRIDRMRRIARAIGVTTCDGCYFSIAAGEVKAKRVGVAN